MATAKSENGKNLSPASIRRDVYEKLRQIADDRQTSISEIIRELIPLFDQKSDYERKLNEQTSFNDWANKQIGDLWDLVNAMDGALCLLPDYNSNVKRNLDQIRKDNTHIKKQVAARNDSPEFQQMLKEVQEGERTYIPGFETDSNGDVIYKNDKPVLISHAFFDKADLSPEATEKCRQEQQPNLRQTAKKHKNQKSFQLPRPAMPDPDKKQ